MKSLFQSPFVLPAIAAAIALVVLYVSLSRRRALGLLEAAVLIAVASVALIVFGAVYVNSYGWTVFVALPLLIGFASVLFYGRNAPPYRFGRYLAVGSTALTLVGIGLLLVAVEGAICLLMALPLAFLLMFAGVGIAYHLQARFWRSRSAPALLLLLVLGSPLLMGAEAAAPRQAPLYEVSTSIIVAAPPEVVWRHVVAFPDLPAPDEWIFRAGVAYPVRTEIGGAGAGTPRRCVLSTGVMPETVEVWDEPRRLRFAVLHTPPSMRELSPYGAIHPPHLEGFYVSRRGEFRLDPLPGGRTRVVGTSWYQHGLYPAGYWRLWSDWVVHQVHRRVLEDVKRLSEGETARRVAL